MNQDINRTPLIILTSLLCEICREKLFTQVRIKKPASACEGCQVELNKWRDERIAMIPKPKSVASDSESYYQGNGSLKGNSHGPEKSCQKEKGFESEI